MSVLSMGKSGTIGAAASRIDWVDFAKGLCIIFVVMMHSTLGVEKAAGEAGWMHYVVQFAKPFRMPDFFLISGLFLGLAIARPWRRYFDRKVVHFAYFYVLWVTIQFALKAPGWIAEGAGFAEIATMWLYAFIQPFGTMWFIYALPIFFLITRAVRSVPWPLVLGIAALLEILPIHTGWVLVDETASRFVYFYAGYAFATHIFALAQWARDNVALSLAGLALWAVINGVLTFMPAPGSIVENGFVSDMPLVSLALGSAGAIAIILTTALLSQLRWAAFLAYIGRNSIVVYLAFFFPMAVSRIVLLKFAPMLDIGTVSALVTAAGVTGPIILHFLIQWTGYGRFLFERPRWARLEQEKVKRETDLRLKPAE